MIRNRLLPHHSQRSHTTTTTTDDADAAAGTSTNHHHHGQHPMTIPPPLSCDSGIASTNFASAPPSGNLEFFEDLVSEPVLVLGVDISHLSRKGQFIVCATGVFIFSLLYGFLQELISVTLLDRKLGLFLAAMQFTGYVFWAFLLQRYVYGPKGGKSTAGKLKDTPKSSPTKDTSSTTSKHDSHFSSSSPPPSYTKLLSWSYPQATKEVPMMMYLGLSLLRAIDLGMTNLAMQYINYPAKTLMKSSRVVFTMLFGILILRKRYRLMDYFVVALMVSGLTIFMHADANTSAVFHHLGIIMLTISLLCDGAITNMSESIMNQFGVGQDEFILNMYSIALVAISLAALGQGDLQEGLRFLGQTGTYGELHLPVEERSQYWTPLYKMGVLLLFSTMGFFGSSCSAAITKNFGAMTMSLTSTVRKATTLFISFAIFDNECTMEHVTGIALFMSSLVMKTLWKSSRSSSSSPNKNSRNGGRRRPPRKFRLSSHNLESLATTSPTATANLDVASGSADSSNASHHHHHQESSTTEETVHLLEMPTYRGDKNHVYVA